MDTKVVAITSAPEPGHSEPRPDVRPASRDGTPKAPEANPVEVRLVIEQDQASGSYVYKTIDRATGEVLLQLPRDEVLKLRGEVNYAAGSIIRTRA